MSEPVQQPGEPEISGCPVTHVSWSWRQTPDGWFEPAPDVGVHEMFMEVAIAASPAVPEGGRGLRKESDERHRG